MAKELLIIRITDALPPEHLRAVRNTVLAQRETGIIVLPRYCEVLSVPDDVKIEFEEKEKRK